MADTLTSSAAQKYPKPRRSRNRKSHSEFSWTTCYDNRCLVHRSEKEANGVFPKRPNSNFTPNPSRAPSAPQPRSGRENARRFPRRPRNGQRNDHSALSWTTCCDDRCLVHRPQKQRYGWWPMEPATVPQKITNRDGKPEPEVYW